MMNKIRLLVFILLFIQLHSLAQDQPLIDSLQAELSKYNASKTEQGKNAPSIDDTTAVILMLRIAGAYLNIDPASSIDYANKSLTLAERINYKKGMGNAYNEMGRASNQTGDIRAALGFYQEALHIREDINDQRGIAACYNNMGIIYLTQGDHLQALKHYFAALKMNESSGNILWQIYNLNNIGTVYEQQENLAEALKFYNAGLQISEQTGNKSQTGIGYNNIGNIHYRQSNDAEALKNYITALSIFKESGQLNAQSSAFNNIGLIYHDQGKYPEALAQFASAISVAEEIEDKTNMASSYLFMADTYILQKRLQLAAAYLEKALSILKETGDVDRLKDTYRSLSLLNTEQGDYKQALAHYELYITYRDSLINEDNIRRTLQLQMQYDFDKQQVADSLQFSREKEVGALKLQRQKAITYTGFAGAALTLLLLYLVYQNYQKQRLANHQLKEAQDQLIKTEKMAAFGIMASRVSHEILNPLNFVNNFSELSQEIVTDVLTARSEEEKKESADILINNLKKIHEHGIRASGIVKQLQELSLKGSAHAFFEEDQQ